jgi:hypothetical protein
MQIETKDIITMLNKNIVYENMYKIFESAYWSNLPIQNWYKKEIVEKI